MVTICTTISTLQTLCILHTSSICVFRIFVPVHSHPISNGSKLCCLKYELISVLKKLMYFLYLILPYSLKLIFLFVSSYTSPACPSYESSVKMNERVCRVGGTTLTGKHRGPRRESARVPPRARRMLTSTATE